MRLRLDCPDRVFRGGFWFFPAWFARVAFCSANGPSLRNDNLGLRLMRRVS